MSQASHHPQRRSAKQRGQAIVMTAIVLPFLLIFTLFVIEVAERWLQVAMLEDALQHATRSAVQQMDYAAFARNETALRRQAGSSPHPCGPLTLAEAQRTRAACLPVIEAADRIFQVNVQQVRGLQDSPATVAAQVRWTVRPQGGRCTYSNGQAVPDLPNPLLCAEVRPTMRGVVGWGTYAPLIIAADRLDAIR